MLRPSNLLWFDHRNNIWWRVQITKLLIQFSPASRQFLLLLLLPLRFKYFSKTPGSSSVWSWFLHGRNLDFLQPFPHTWNFALFSNDLLATITILNITWNERESGKIYLYGTVIVLHASNRYSNCCYIHVKTSALTNSAWSQILLFNGVVHIHIWSCFFFFWYVYFINKSVAGWSPEIEVAKVSTVFLQFISQRYERLSLHGRRHCSIKSRDLCVDLNLCGNTWSSILSSDFSLRPLWTFSTTVD